jgi:hypothetical protein
VVGDQFAFDPPPLACEFFAPPAGQSPGLAERVGDHDRVAADGGDLGDDVPFDLGSGDRSVDLRV